LIKFWKFVSENGKPLLDALLTTYDPVPAVAGGGGGGGGGGAGNPAVQPVEDELFSRRLQPMDDDPFTQSLF
jgi:hypothetical protein